MSRGERLRGEVRGLFQAWPYLVFEPAVCHLVEMHWEVMCPSVPTQVKSHARLDERISWKTLVAGLIDQK